MYIAVVGGKVIEAFSIQFGDSSVLSPNTALVILHLTQVYMFSGQCLACCLDINSVVTLTAFHLPVPTFILPVSLPPSPLRLKS